MGSTQTEPNALLDTEEERVRQAFREMWQARLNHLNLQKSGIEKEAEAIRKFLRVTESNGG